MNFDGVTFVVEHVAKHMVIVNIVKHMNNMLDCLKKMNKNLKNGKFKIKVKKKLMSQKNLWMLSIVIVKYENIFVVFHTCIRDRSGFSGHFDSFCTKNAVQLKS